MRHIFGGTAWLVLVLLGGCAKESGADAAPTEGAEVAGERDATPSASDTALTATAEPDVAAVLASATRDKLLALAVASECLRKGNTPPEQSANTMLALYKAHDIDLATYTREMSRLAGDPAFQAEIDAKTSACPAANPPDAAADAIVEPDTVSAPADSGPVAVVDAGAPDTLGSAADALADTRVAAPDTQVAMPDTTVPEAVVVDTRVAEEVAPERPEVDFSGTWTGKLYGGSSPGSLRMTISGRTITAATVTFGRTSVRLKGSISERGALNLGGTSGDDFVRVSGTAQASGRAINGTWDGVVDRKRGNGRLLLKR